MTTEKLKVTRDNVRNFAARLLEDGTKPNTNMLLEAFESKGVTALRVHFAEWKEENKELLRPHSQLEKELMIENKILKKDIEYFKNQSNKLQIELDIAKQSTSTHWGQLAETLEVLEELSFEFRGDSHWLWHFDGIEPETHYSSVAYALAGWIEWAIAELQNSLPPIPLNDEPNELEATENI